MDSAHALWRHGQHGWPARYPIVQFPNAPLLVALAGMIAAGATDGKAHGYAVAVARVFLGIWAYIELTDGANAFRRVLGAVFLVLTVVKLGDALG